MRESKLTVIDFCNNLNRDIATNPVTYGVPLPTGSLPVGQGVEIRTAAGLTIPVQSQPLATHADGSVKWLLLDFAMPVKANERGQLELRRVVSGGASVATGMTLTEDSEAIVVKTRKLTVRINKKKFSLFDSYVIDGVELAAPGSDIIVEDTTGKVFSAANCRQPAVRVTVRGDQRVVVEATGRHTATDGTTLFDFRLRWTFRPEEPGVALAYKFTNREEPELGVLVRNIRIELPTELRETTTKVLRQEAHGVNWFPRIVEIAEDVEIFAAGAVNATAKERYGGSADGVVLIRNFASLGEKLEEYPHYLRPGNARADMSGGLRQMYPYVSMNDGTRAALAWFYEMGNNYPKSVSVVKNKLTFDIWPAWATEFRLRRGQSKEHDFHVVLFANKLTPEATEDHYFSREMMGLGIHGNCTKPVDLLLDPAYVRSCKVLNMHRWLTYDEDRYLAVEVKLGTACATHNKYDRGMMDLGDSVGQRRAWCHNNENDSILQMIQEYYRRREASVLHGALQKARHNAHVDFIAHDPDPLRCGTMPAHCPEHTDGATYPSHMWVDGLMAAYCVSGETDYLEASLAVGENMLRWQKMRPEIFYADSRECGWPMLAFLRLHEHTGEQRWLDGCEEVFRFYKEKTGADGTIKYALPHGLGLTLQGYGEFVAWRGLFFYWERTGRDDVKKFLERVLPQGYLRHPRDTVRGGWGANDLFPAWAAWQLTGDDKFIEDNYPFFRFLMRRSEGFPWGGIDMHPYLAELDRRGVLAEFCQ